MAHVGEHLAKRGRVSRHFQAHIEAFVHVQFFLHLGQRCFRCIHGARNADLARQLQAVRVHIRNHDVARAGMPATAALMMPIGPAPVISTSSASTGNESAV